MYCRCPSCASTILLGWLLGSPRHLRCPCSSPVQCPLIFYAVKGTMHHTAAQPWSQRGWVSPGASVLSSGMFWGTGGLPVAHGGLSTFSGAMCHLPTAAPFLEEELTIPRGVGGQMAGFPKALSGCTRTCSAHGMGQERMVLCCPTVAFPRRYFAGFLVFSPCLLSSLTPATYFSCISFFAG